MKLITDSSCIYLQGFASIPQSTKAKDLCDRFTQIQIKLKVPDLNTGDFSHLIITRQINQVTAGFPDHYAPLTLIDFSLGGLISAGTAKPTSATPGFATTCFWVFIPLFAQVGIRKDPKLVARTISLGV
jgi:hypothetical protein